MNLTTMSSIKALVPINDDIIAKVRQIYNKSDKDVKSDIEILQEWLKQQRHLPNEQDVNRLEHFILRNKFQIERTKFKLDKYYTYRGLHPEFFVSVDPKCDSLQAVRKTFLWVPMPKLLSTSERIIAASIPDKEAKFFNMIDVFTYIFNISDILISYDYASAYRVVIDLSGVGWNHMTKLDPTVLKKGASLYQHAFSGRLSHIEFINIPPVFDVLFALLKRVLDSKLIDKIRMYKDFDAAHENVPKEYLPKEFGGDQESMIDLHEKWGEELEHQKEFLVENTKKISNENLRVGKPIHSEQFGVDGTFKKINID